MYAIWFWPSSKGDPPICQLCFSAMLLSSHGIFAEFLKQFQIRWNCHPHLQNGTFLSSVLEKQNLVESVFTALNGLSDCLFRLKSWYQIDYFSLSISWFINFNQITLLLCNNETLIRLMSHKSWKKTTYFSANYLSFTSKFVKPLITKLRF